MIDFIFMLTRDDRTIEDSLDLMRLIEPVGLKHVGFKDVGVPRAALKTLVADIHRAGAISYMEVVSTMPEVCLQSARIARDLGVRRLLGGTQVDEILGILDGSDTAYFPFAGKPVGHPTKLGGTAADAEADCRAFVRKGCAGCDVLAYRATEADPIDLVRAARKGLGPDKYLIVAGAVTSAAQIRAIKAAGANAFTIGTAVLNGSYSPSKGSILSQLRDVLADCEGD
ncbi:4-hydroxythreonine-4-phosphate dehydrogenase [Pseudaminobacter sp. 19-2017]|uniref:4-hydroxythreonine-4-phosphate dehydrogenase n=1 Tax=Pseudaminobacter soli (ex Zhang et al. 2022) TaxID=2831468 RepID=A0A942DWQ4_9HYPH|nr:4-hydroxythreonine-4-phosphate dehydrogenase [Pseudaminobacter soli]MBS3648142.1 4-hydroxythreonine-4-phosphate dehydrogenase [Pseudaminobacter soli]